MKLICYNPRMNSSSPWVSASAALILLALTGCGGNARHDLLIAQKRGRGADRDNAAPSTVGIRYTLRAEKTWQLNPPNGERFDASGLLLTPEGNLLTVSDRGPSLYQIQLQENTNAANILLLPKLFTREQLAGSAGENLSRFDVEGIGRDEQGRLYICEESHRWIFRADPRRDHVELLKIDWSPVQKYFDAVDLNASFEGVAAGKGRLYVANERQRCRIIVVDLKTLGIIDDFSVRPSASHARDLHYSDLCWFDDALFVLLRESRRVLKIDPESHRVLVEYNFSEMESGPEVLYRTRYPTGTMEGLAVDREFIWIVTDNNGLGRARYPRDLRPTLFKCRRPDR